MRIRTIKQIKNLAGKRVLARFDFNVPVKNGQVADNFRLLKGLPTIEYLLKKQAAIILMTHLGRPDGEVKKEFSVAPVKKDLEKLLNRKIKLFGLDELAKLAKTELGRGEVVMLENTRFSPDEKKSTGTFAKDLAALADLFVLDGFAVAHRPAASVVGVAKYLPSYAGLLLTQEIDGLSKVTDQPKPPLVAILGGAKIETKIPIMKNLLAKADYILVGGGIVNTYLWAKGYQVGQSLINKDYKKEALSYGGKPKVIMPVDVVAGTFDGRQHQVIMVDKNLKVKAGWGIYDVGPATIKLYSQYIRQAQTLIWNGAMGRFEQHPYEYGTYAMARLVASRSRGKAFGVCGGGETVEVLAKLKLMDDIDLVSTGGGAMLEFLSGERLPGVEIVKN